jgi:molecular chaperone GrpE
MNRIIAARYYSQKAVLFRGRGNSVLTPMSTIHTGSAAIHSDGSGGMSHHQSWRSPVVAGAMFATPKTTARHNILMHPFGGIRSFSDAKDSNNNTEDPTTEPPSNNDTTTEEHEATNGGGGATEGVVPDEQQKLKLMEVQIKDLKNQLLRSLADQENTRRIAKRDVESAKQFAIKSFAKSLLETSDNLERALDAVPQDLLLPSSSTVDLHGVLVTLYEGIRMTEEGLNKALESNGLERFGTVGDVFDPNLHEALFEYPDPTKEPGTLGQVMKPGFLLNKRVLRPAEVGVIKKEA